MMMNDFKQAAKKVYGKFSFVSLQIKQSKERLTLATSNVQRIKQSAMVST